MSGDSGVLSWESAETDTGFRTVLSSHLQTYSASTAAHSVTMIAAMMYQIDPNADSKAAIQAVKKAIRTGQESSSGY